MTPWDTAWSKPWEDPQPVPSAPAEYKAEAREPTEAERLWTARQSEIDQQVETFKTAIENLGAKWKAEISALLKEAPSKEIAAKVQYLSELQRNVRKQLQDIGYDDLAHDFMGVLEASEQASLANLQALGVDIQRIAPLDQNALRALRNVEFNRLVRAGDNTAAVVAEGVVQNALGGLSRTKMIENVGKTLDAGLVNRSVTIVDNALVTYDRSVIWDAGAKAGIEQFKFAGPADRKNSPFCAEHVGKVYPKEWWMTADNGTAYLPIWTWGGHIGCRHVPQPYVETKS